MRPCRGHRRRFAGLSRRGGVNARSSTKARLWPVFCGGLRQRGKSPQNRVPAEAQRKRVRWKEDKRQRERALPLAAKRGIRRPLGRRPASRLSGLRQRRCPAFRLFAGRCPTPLVGAKSAPFGTPCGERYSELRSLAPPLQTKPAVLGFRLALRKRLFWRKQHEKRY